LTPLGAKGLAEGNCMSVPACVANAIADALGVKDVMLPASPRRIHALIAGDEPPPPEGAQSEKGETPLSANDGRDITGSGSFEVEASPEEVWRSLLDPEALRKVIPGCHSLSREGENAYRAEVSLGVGPVRGRFRARVALSDLEAPSAARLSGSLSGPLGAASGGGQVRLSPTESGTRIDYDYAVTVSGTAAAVGGRLLDSATAIIIRKFFEGLARYVGPQGKSAAGDGAFAALWRFILSLFGGGK
jgi:2-furoyl-CoA dehydrogenase large subunit